MLTISDKNVEITFYDVPDNKQTRAQHRAIAKKIAQRNKPTKKISKQGMCPYDTGTVYIIAPSNWKELEIFPAKIGKSSNSNKARIKQIQQANWVELVYIDISEEIPHPLKLERKLHDLFDNVRIRGEWFNLTHSDLQIIQNHLETAKIAI